MITLQKESSAIKVTMKLASTKCNGECFFVQSTITCFIINPFNHLKTNFPWPKLIFNDNYSRSLLSCHLGCANFAGIMFSK